MDPMKPAPLLRARVTNSEEGMYIAARSMAAQVALLEVHSDNIAYSAIPGYQAQRPVMRPFVEYLGANAVERSTSEEIGRLRKSGNASDVALATEGYFQRLDPATGEIRSNRDGRMQVDNAGYLKAHDGTYFLGTDGQPIRFSTIPSNFYEQVKIDGKGRISYIDPKTQTMEAVGTLSVVSSDGDPVADVKIAQGFVEDSNVYIAREFAGLLPKRRDFEANRQLFQLQNGNLQKMIQDLGRAQ